MGHEFAASAVFFLIFLHNLYHQIVASIPLSSPTHKCSNGLSLSTEFLTTLFGAVADMDIFQMFHKTMDCVLFNHFTAALRTVVVVSLVCRTDVKSSWLLSVDNSYNKI